MFQAMLLSFIYIIYFIQIFYHFSFRSVIFASTSGIKDIELNVNKLPIYLASLLILKTVLRPTPVGCTVCYIADVGVCCRFFVEVVKTFSTICFCLGSKPP